jgi:hypothetical protein
LLNFGENTFGVQRCTMQMIASGALDRHPALKVLKSEGGATWGPLIADRLDEAYRAHGAAVRPRLSRLPSGLLWPVGAFKGRFADMGKQLEERPLADSV